MEGCGKEIIPAVKLAEGLSRDSADFSVIYVGVAEAIVLERVHRTTPPGPSLLLAEKTISGLPGQTWHSLLIVTYGQGSILCSCPPCKSTRYKTLRPPLKAANSAIFPESSTIA